MSPRGAVRPAATCGLTSGTWWPVWLLGGLVSEVGAGGRIKRASSPRLREEEQEGETARIHVRAPLWKQWYP